MTLQEFISQKKLLSYPQRIALIDLLSKGCTKETKQKVKELVDNKFYSSFDQSLLAKKIVLSAQDVQFHGNLEDLRKFRKEHLK